MNNMKSSVKSVLHMESITMQLGDVMAVSGLILDVNEHEIVALTRPNGADKTTTFNCITGIYQPIFGSISFNGEVVLADTPQGKMRRLYEGDVSPADLTPVRRTSDRITKLGIAETFQNIRLSGALTAFESILIAKHMRAKRNVFSATLRLNHTEEERMHRESMALLEIRGLAHLKDEVAPSLPYGLRRRLETTRALATSPNLLLLDEPTAGMNPQEAQDLIDFARKIRNNYRLTIFMIEHHMDLVMQMLDRIYVLNSDKLVARGTLGQIQNNPKVIETYPGVSEGAED